MKSKIENVVRTIIPSLGKGFTTEYIIPEHLISANNQKEDQKNPEASDKKSKDMAKWLANIISNLNIINFNNINYVETDIGHKNFGPNERSI